MYKLRDRQVRFASGIISLLELRCWEDFCGCRRVVLRFMRWRQVRGVDGCIKLHKLRNWNLVYIEWCCRFFKLFTLPCRNLLCRCSYRLCKLHGGQIRSVVIGFNLHKLCGWNIFSPLWLYVLRELHGRFDRSCCFGKRLYQLRHWPVRCRARCECLCCVRGGPIPACDRAIGLCLMCSGHVLGNRRRVALHVLY
jgi:hypothetical protein